MCNVCTSVLSKPVRWQEGMSELLDVTKKELPVLMRTRSPVALDQTAHNVHQGLVVIAGNSFSLSCSSPDKMTFFHWLYCRLGDRAWLSIYSGVRINPHLHLDVHFNNCDDTTCTLNVDAPSLSDAGFFACVRYRPTVYVYWSITVLGKDSWNYSPTCLR